MTVSTCPPVCPVLQFNEYAAHHPGAVICNFNYRGNNNINVPCQVRPNDAYGQDRVSEESSRGHHVAIETQIQTDAIIIAKQNFSTYSKEFLSPSNALMIRTGLWLELEAAIGLLVGLGLGSLLGQRTVSVIIMLVYEVILTPLLAQAHIAHLINVQRGLVGLATAHLEPSALPPVFGGNNGPGSTSNLIPESRLVAVLVIVAWIVVWTGLGARRMAKRDA